jgi:hypothetical protein
MPSRHKDSTRYENHQREAEIQDAAEHTHRAAEQKHDTQEHLTGHERTRQGLEHSQNGHQNGHLNNQSATVGHGIASFGHDDIAALAYELWEARGCPVGSPELDWFHAVKELRSRAIAG